MAEPDDTDPHDVTAIALMDFGADCVCRLAWHAAQTAFAQALRQRLWRAAPDDPGCVAARVALMAAFDPQDRRVFAHLVEDSTEFKQGREGVDADALTVIAAVAHVLEFMGARRAACHVARAVLALRRRDRGPEHAATLTAMGELAWCLAGRGRVSAADRKEAEALRAEAVVIRRRILGDDHPDTLVAVIELARAHDRAGASACARSLFLEGLVGLLRVAGSDHVHVGVALSGLAYLDAGPHDDNQRLRAVRGLIGLSRQHLGPDHAFTLRALSSLGANLAARHDPVGAKSTYAELLAARRRVLGEDHPETLESMVRLGRILTDLEEHDAAIAMQSRVLVVRRRESGAEHEDTLAAIGLLAWTLSEAGQHDAAAPLLEESLAAVRRSQPNEENALPEALEAIARNAMARGDVVRARRIRAEVLTIVEQMAGDNHWEMVRALLSLAATFVGADEVEHSRDHFARAVAWVERFPQVVFSYEILDDLIRDLRRMGDHDRARRMRLRVLGMRWQSRR